MADGMSGNYELDRKAHLQPISNGSSDGSEQKKVGNDNVRRGKSQTTVKEVSRVLKSDRCSGMSPITGNKEQVQKLKYHRKSQFKVLIRGRAGLGR